MKKISMPESNKNLSQNIYFFCLLDNNWIKDHDILCLIKVILVLKSKLC